MLGFFMPGPPFKKERPRFGKGRVYAHPESVAAEAALRHYAKLAMAGRAPLTGPVQLDVQFVFGRPKSQRGPARDALHHTSRNDIDNCIKLVMDALNPHKKTNWPGVWVDDRQVCLLHAAKLWTCEGVDILEGTSVTVTDLS
jgi:Holliday junction resolvase RusA-like endonuclease